MRDLTFVTTSFPPSIAAATSAEVGYASILTLTQTFPNWIKTLETYTGCGEFIRQVGLLFRKLALTPGFLSILKAISSPGKATEEAAWEAILPAISKLKDVYEFAMQVGMCRESRTSHRCMLTIMLSFSFKFITEAAFPKLVAFLCAEDPTSSFEKYEAFKRECHKPIPILNSNRL